MSDFDDLDNQLDQLNSGLGQSASMVSAFNGELSKMQGGLGKTSGDLKSLEKSFSSGLRGALDGLITDGAKLSDVFRNLALSIADTAFKAAITPVTDHLGGMFGNLVNGMFGGAFANGAAFSEGKVVPFANGGVVSSPTFFPMKGATGLMGEAGPEAIMPLTRGADGRLGVAAQGGGGGQNVNITMNISTPDVQGFQRSQSQIAAQMTRAMSAGQRNR